MSHFRLQEEIAQPSNLPLKPEVIHNPHYQEYLKLSNKQWYFSDLLPMDKEKTILRDNKQKIQILNILKHLYQSAADALYAFYIDRRVDLFDGHVGEASCQIRAAKLANLLKKINIKVASRVLIHMQNYQRKTSRISELIEVYVYSRKKIDGKMLLRDILKKYDLEYDIEVDNIFLITCFILNKFKLTINRDTDIIDYNKVVDVWNLSKSYALKIFKHTQKTCSYISVHYVFHSVSLADSALLCYMLQKDSSGRWVLPALEVTEYMLNEIQSGAVPIILNISSLNGLDEAVKEYRFVYLNGEYKRLSDADIRYVQTQPYFPLIVIECFRKYSAQESEKTILHMLNQYELPYLVKCAIATHSQYAGAKLASLALYPYQSGAGYIEQDILDSKTAMLRDLQASALKHGLCKLNPELCAFTHIYCTASNLL